MFLFTQLQVLLRLDIYRKLQEIIKTTTTMDFMLINCMVFLICLLCDSVSSYRNVSTVISKSFRTMFVLSPVYECALVRKAQTGPRITTKDLIEMLEEAGTGVSAVKQGLNHQNLKCF